MAKVEKTQKLFLDALKQKFPKQDVASTTAEFYKFNGLEQSPRKREFMAENKKIEAARGISMYDPNRCHLGGIPMGQRQLPEPSLRVMTCTSSTMLPCSRCGMISAEP